MDELFTPMLRQKAQRPREPVVAEGHTTLEVVVPNWSRIPWEEVLKLREHPAMVEFRKRMITIERVARESVSFDPSLDLQDELRKVYEDDLMDEIESLRITGRDVAKDVAIDFTTGQVPVPGLSTIITEVRGLMKLRAEERSWVSPLLKLRNIARESVK
jgi:hypothetical protein